MSDDTDARAIIELAANLPMMAGGYEDRWTVCPACKRSIPPTVDPNTPDFPHRDSCLVRRARAYLAAHPIVALWSSADDPALDYTRLNHVAPPFVRDGEGDAPGVTWYTGNWRERAYRIQEAEGTLLPTLWTEKE